MVGRQHSPLRMFGLQKHRKTPTQSKLDKPLSIHTHRIFPQPEEKEDQKPTPEIGPAIVQDRRWYHHTGIPRRGVMDGREGEGLGTWGRNLDDEDVDLERGDADEKDKGDDEEAEEAGACCVAAGEDGVEGGFVFEETDNDDDCDTL